MTKKAFILIGVPGSGKSTWLKNQIGNTAEKVGIFSLDTCRLTFAQTDDYAAAFKYCIENQKDFDEYVNVAWHRTISVNETAHREGNDVILGREQNDIVYVDNVNATRKSRARWISDLKSKGYEVHAIQFDVPLQVAIDRQLTRKDKSVPADVITRMYYSIQEVLTPSECTSVSFYTSF